jgi:NADH pyrophosphatase NudC (nudix superfamily)
MLPFTGNPLDHLSEKRGDAAWVAEQLRSARVLPVWRQQVLTSGETLLRAASVPHVVGDALAAPDAACVLLGLDGEAAVFALDVSAAESAGEALKPYGQFRELRAAAPFLRRKDLAILSQAGESLEEAVRRESFEEVGVTVGKVTYFASQPWPFPASLMIGCYAECESKTLKLNPTEIAEAEWFSKARALDLIEGRIEGWRGPMTVAIAYHLIKEWAKTSS